MTEKLEHEVIFTHEELCELIFIISIKDKNRNHKRKIYKELLDKLLCSKLNATHFSE